MKLQHSPGLLPISTPSFALIAWLGLAASGCVPAVEPGAGPKLDAAAGGGTGGKQGGDASTANPDAGGTTGTGALAPDGSSSWDGSSPGGLGPADSSSADASPPGASETGGTDTGTSDQRPADAGGEPINLFVAQGHLGRTTVSCDDGRTWVANHSDDDAAICFTPTLDCDHTAGAGRGITHGNGWFVATFGWGQPGSIRRSRDGVVWEKVTQNTTFAGVAFGNGLFLAGGKPAWTASGEGGTWQMAGDPALTISSVRRAGFVPHAGGRFLLHANGGGSDTMLSSDGARTWWRPTTLPAECGTDQWSGGFASGAGVILMVNGQGLACRSTDGGLTFTTAQLGGTVEGRLIWTGTEFMTWGQRGVYRSRDGASWTSQPTVPANLIIGPVALGDTGTFVAVRGGWDQWYARQQFYRSRDGVSWEILPTTAFTPSHPMTFIAHGRGIRPAACR